MEAILQRVEQLSSKFDEFTKQINTRFDALEGRVTTLEGEIVKLSTNATRQLKRRLSSAASATISVTSLEQSRPVPPLKSVVLVQSLFRGAIDRAVLRNKRALLCSNTGQSFYPCGQFLEKQQQQLANTLLSLIHRMRVIF